MNCGVRPDWTQETKKPVIFEMTGFLLNTGAGKEARTLDLYLGKVSLYQLSYSRIDYLTAPAWAGRYRIQQEFTITFETANTLYLEEKVGFEPTVPFGTPDFESGTFGHSATSPILSRLKLYQWPSPLLRRQSQGGDFLLSLTRFIHQLQGGVDGIDLRRCIFLQLSGQTGQGGRAFGL